MRKGLEAAVRGGRARGDLMQKARPVLRPAIDRIGEMGLSEGHVRRLFTSEAFRLRHEPRRG